MEEEVENTGSLILDIEVGGSDKISSQQSGAQLNFRGNTMVDSVLTGTDMSGHVVTASADGAQVLLANGASESATDASLLGPTVSGHFVADATTLRSLIASGAVQLTDAEGQPLEISSDTAQVFTMFNQPGTSGGEGDQTSSKQELEGDDITDMLSMSAIPQITLPPLPTSVPPGTPAWAARLRDFQKIGDYYRGWVENDIELDLLLTYHKQQTHSTWGTRQSPCPNKPTTRLMWRSQYVPFDGIPFLNAGSRAIVMECQYGPRRKGTLSKKDLGPLNQNFKKTCPARIYVKKVKKFVEYGVELVNDKKVLKAEMDRAFELLRKKNFRAFYQERYYVQLPTLKAHENHIVSEGTDTHTGKLATAVTVPIMKSESTPGSRLHPLVQNKIRSLVANGETRLYAIRKHLRKYVEKDLFEQAENVPDRHNLTYFPTVHDLQNHIHQAILDINSGVLTYNDNITMEVVTEDNDKSNLQLRPSKNTPHAETVTVTLQTASDGDEGHVVSKVETYLSDGTTRVSDTLSPQTARLLAKLHPNMFPLDSLVQHVALTHGQQTSVKLQVPSASAESQLLAAEATSGDKPSISSVDIDSGVHTETIDLAAAAELVSVPQEETEEIEKATQKELNSSTAPQPARLIAASTDQSGYALVQTETGAFLLAKGNPAGGLYVLGQTGATFTANFAQPASNELFTQKDSSSTLADSGGGDQSQTVTEIHNIQSNAMTQLGANLAAGDSIIANSILQNIKLEDSGDNHSIQTL